MVTQLLLELDATGVPAGWRSVIVAEVVDALGEVTVLLLGSRALGTAAPSSDVDVAVVDTLGRCASCVGRLPALQARLTRLLGVPVSVNPIPASRLTGATNSLYRYKVRHEAVVLHSANGFTLAAPGSVGVSRFSSASYVLSAILAVLEAVPSDPAASAASGPALTHAVRKAVLHVAQLRLLDRRRYASTLDRALTDLGDGALTSLADAADAPDALGRVRALLLHEAAARPLEMPRWKAPLRNAQFALIAQRRGRPSWRRAMSLRSVECSVATQLVALLAELPSDPDHLAGAGVTMSASWCARRDAVATAWHDAHPLAGLLA